MHSILCVILLFTGTNGAVLRPSTSIERNQNSIFIDNLSNETHFTWILYPPWKLHNDLFNDKSYNYSGNYFGISKEDHITNESYIETSKLTVCKNVNLTFYSKIHRSLNKIKLILFIYQHNIWNKVWKYIHNDSQWQFHQLNIHVTDKNEDIQLRFLPISNSSDQISIGIAISSITTHTNCTFNQMKSQLQNSSHHRSFSSIHLFLLIIFGSIFLLLFGSVMVAFICNMISKHYNGWTRKRSSRRRRKGRKIRNVVRDESTILHLETDAV